MGTLFGCIRGNFDFISPFFLVFVLFSTLMEFFSFFLSLPLSPDRVGPSGVETDETRSRNVGRRRGGESSDGDNLLATGRDERMISPLLTLGLPEQLVRIRFLFDPCPNKKVSD